jgi:hypothetical protein
MIEIAIITGLECKRKGVGNQQVGERKQRVPGSEEDKNVLLIHVWQYHKETHQILFLKEREEEGG